MSEMLPKYYIVTNLLPDETGFIPSGEWKLKISKPHAWRPPTDLIETDDSLIVRVEIAGMSDSDFSISFEQNLLTISGSRSEEAVEHRSFHQMEINFGEFLTTVDITSPVDTEKARAEYRNGFLRIFLPKVQPKHIHISTDTERDSQ